MLDLYPFFSPSSVAIVGVSSGDVRFGGVGFLSTLMTSGYEGRLYPINPHAREIMGIPSFRSISDLPEVPDLAMVCIGARRIPALLEECARIGLQHIHILSAGFKETGTTEGADLEAEIVRLAAHHGLLIIGPNCMGPYHPASGMTPWGRSPSLEGPLGIVSQSGGLAQRLAEYCSSLGVGIRYGVSIGNAAVLDTPDFLEFMAGDEGVKLIALYLEGIREGKRLFQMVRDIGVQKPIIILKGGETDRGAAMAASHTGSLSGKGKLWEAFVRQTGAVQVRSIREWVDVILAFRYLKRPKGRGTFVVGGGGGNSVLFADMCIREGLEIPLLSDFSLKRLREIVPAIGSIASNPLDHFQTMHDPDCLKKVIDIAYEDPNIHMVIVDCLIPRKTFYIPQVPFPADEILKFMHKHKQKKPTAFIIDSEGGDTELAFQGTVLRAQFSRGGCPSFVSAGSAARALNRLCRYHESRKE